jgi:hypothetical protein
MTAIHSLHTARALHKRLIEETDLAPQGRYKIAREISGHLFAIEANTSPLSNRCRLVFLRLRTDAHNRGTAEGGELTRGLAEVNELYDELQHDCGLA